MFFGFVTVCCVACSVFADELEETPSERDESAVPAKQGDDFALSISDRIALELVWIEALGMWVGKYEVTNDQFRSYDMAHKSDLFYKKNINQLRQPAVNVSWYDADNFCAWLNRRFAGQLPPGYAFRLPEESEWEVFASCGDDRKYHWGDGWPPPDNLNYRGEEGSSFLFRIFEHDDVIKGRSDGFIVSAPVEESGVNEWGLFGVGGNVWEWCLGFYSKEYDERILKGGAWNTYYPDNLLVSAKAGAPATWKNAMIGFRVVLAPLTDDD